jgi:hypothetical protein
MKIDLFGHILDHEDKPIVENGETVTVATALKRALLAAETTAQNKLEHFELWLKVKAATAETEFSVAEMSLLDKAIAFYPTLIHGRLSHLLSNKVT